jgi:hypothetical protein
VPDKIREHALYLVHKDQETNLDGTSPVLKACRNILLAAKQFGYDLSATQTASALGISTAGVRMAIKRLR